MSNIVKEKLQGLTSKQKKIASFAIIVIFALILGLLLVALNSGSSSTDGNNQENVSETDVLDEDSSADSSPSFSQADATLQVSVQNITSPEYMKIDFQNDIWSFGSGGKLQKNAEIIPDSPDYSPVGLKIIGENIIINQETKTSIYDGNQFIDLDKVIWITETNEGLVYIYNNGDDTKNEYQIKKAEGINEIQEEVSNNLISLPESMNQAHNELFSIDGRTYILSFEDVSKQSKFSIWQLVENQLLKKYDIPNLFSILRMDNSLMITKELEEVQDGSYYQNYLIEVNNKDDLVERPINVYPTLIENGIKGSLLAERCTFDISNLYCLVKINKTPITDFSTDALVAINRQDFRLSLPWKGLNIVASNVHFLNQIYYVRQEDGILYRLEI